PIWPAYPIGSPDVIFALGVASIKYAELESSLVLIFATVLSIPLHRATMIHSRVNSETCVKLIEQMLPSPTLIGAPTRQVSEIRYFIEAFQDCTLNRNHLLHSSVATLTGSESALLYKTSKQGKTIISAPRLEELRRVADDMSAFHLYGRHLSNALN